MKTSAPTKAPTKTANKAAFEDLAPKPEKDVRGGVSFQDFHFTKKVDASSPR